jgi:hypothetical protein
VAAPELPAGVLALLLLLFLRLLMHTSAGGRSVSAVMSCISGMLDGMMLLLLTVVVVLLPFPACHLCRAAAEPSPKPLIGDSDGDASSGTGAAGARTSTFTSVTSIPVRYVATAGKSAEPPETNNQQPTTENGKRKTER